MREGPAGREAVAGRERAFRPARRSPRPTAAAGALFLPPVLPLSLIEEARRRASWAARVPQASEHCPVPDEHSRRTGSRARPQVRIWQQWLARNRSSHRNPSRRQSVRPFCSSPAGCPFRGTPAACDRTRLFDRHSPADQPSIRAADEVERILEHRRVVSTNTPALSRRAQGPVPAPRHTALTPLPRRFAEQEEGA